MINKNKNRLIYFTAERPVDITASTEEKMKQVEERISPEVAQMEKPVKDITEAAIGEIEEIAGSAISGLDSIKSPPQTPAEPVKLQPAMVELPEDTITEAAPRQKILDAMDKAQNRIRANEERYYDIVLYLEVEAETNLELYNMKSNFDQIRYSDKAQLLETCNRDLMTLQSIQNSIQGLKFPDDAKGLIKRKENLLKIINARRKEYEKSAEDTKKLIRQQISQKDDLIKIVDDQLNGPEKVIPSLAQIRELKAHLNGFEDIADACKTDPELVSLLKAKVDQLISVLDAAGDAYAGQDEDLKTLWDEHKQLRDKYYNARDMKYILEGSNDATGNEKMQAVKEFENAEKAYLASTEKLKLKENDVESKRRRFPFKKPAAKDELPPEYIS